MAARPGERGVVPVDGLSHVRGSTARPLVDATVPDFLAEVVRRHGGRTAAVFRAAGERWTYEQLARRVDRFAAGLLSLGLYRGDRIGIWAPNRPEWLIAQFATARIGLILVNINPAYRASELEYALDRVGAKALITARQLKTSAYLEMLREVAPELDACPPGRIRARRLPALRTVIQLGPDPAPGCLSFDEVMDRGGGGQRWRLDAISAGLRPNDPINVQFTSGTTGAPKGATLTHRNIVNNAISCARTMRLVPGESLCIPVPLYHCFGMVLGNLAAAAYGVAMVFPGEVFDAGETLAALDAERLHRGARGADDVRGDARPPGLRALRPLRHADRDHGRGALPGDPDAAGRAGHGLPRDHHRLRHDGRRARSPSSRAWTRTSSTASRRSAGSSPMSR